MGVMSLRVMFWNGTMEHVCGWADDTFDDLLGRLKGKPGNLHVWFASVAYTREQKLSDADIVDGSMILLRGPDTATMNKENVQPKRGRDSTGKRKKQKKIFTQKKVRFLSSEIEQHCHCVALIISDCRRVTTQGTYQRGQVKGQSKLVDRLGVRHLYSVTWSISA
jgi:hypothetical protein